MAGGQRGDHDQLTGLPYAADGDGVRLTVRVTPRARRNGLGGIVEGSDGRPFLAVRLAAPPVEGVANKALVALLASVLGVPKSAVQIVSGETSRVKTLRIACLSAESLARRLEA